MNRLYQWIRKGASFFRHDSSSGAISRTVRTEVTVERRAMTLLVDGGLVNGGLVDSGSANFDCCPLCGQELAPTQAEQTRLRLQAGSTIHPCLPVDRDPP